MTNQEYNKLANDLTKAQKATIKAKIKEHEIELLYLAEMLSRLNNSSYSLSDTILETRKRMMIAQLELDGLRADLRNFR